MTLASIVQIKARLDAYLEASERNPVVITRDGNPIAVPLGVHDEEELERVLLAHSRSL